MTTFSLKLTAAVLMTLDHVGLYFPAAPGCLRWLGRGAYPLFLFCMVQGYAHTRSRDRREALAAVYLIFCVYQFSTEALYGVFPVQWMMALALPLMLRYNGERGRGWKPFFYVYYPAHTCLLFLLARSLGQ